MKFLKEEVTGVQRYEYYALWIVAVINIIANFVR